MLSSWKLQSFGISSSSNGIGVLLGCLGCCSTPKLLEKSEIFRLSEILRRRSEIFIT